MSLQYIIDGYNIIKHPLFTHHTTKKINPVRNTRVLREENKISHGVKDSRIVLLEFIRINRLCGSPKNKITVVFDGYPDSRGLSNNTVINVIFAREESADEKIKRMVEVLSNAKSVVVVSDDKEIRFFVRSFGAKILSIQEFINRSKNLIDSQEKEPMKPELNYSQICEINKELRKLWLK